MSKYEPLSETLTRLKADYWRPTFLELERILDFKLPASARKNDIWWKAEAGGRHTHAHAWSAAGWKVQDVNVDKEKVTFVRNGAAPEAEAEDDETSRLADAWRDRASQAREWGMETRDAAAERLKAHPFAAIGVSVGVTFALGLALGYLLVRQSEPEPEPVYTPRGAEGLARRALDALASGREAYTGRAEDVARRAIGGLTARVHELEDLVRDKIERLRA